MKDIASFMVVAIVFSAGYWWVADLWPYAVGWVACLVAMVVGTAVKEVL